MAIVRTIKAPVASALNNANRVGLASNTPKESDIRSLGAPDLEQTHEYELTSQRSTREAIAPPPMTLDAAAENYARLAGSDSKVVQALQAGELQHVLVALLQENLQLRLEDSSLRTDFEELRSVSVAQQEAAHARLAVTDDERLRLIEQLEQTRTELTALESRCERARLDYETDVEELRSQQDALQQEIAALRDLLPPSVA